ncbi:MAG: hypothetical protein AAF585_28795 [Verrucomicrobiota bacterium]
MEHEYFETTQLTALFGLKPLGSHANQIFTRQFGEQLMVYGQKSALSTAPATVCFGLQVLDSNFFNYTQWSADAGNGTIAYLSPTNQKENPRNLALTPEQTAIPISQPRKNVKAVSISRIGQEAEFVDASPSQSLELVYLADVGDQAPGGFTAAFEFEDGSSEEFSFFASNELFHAPSPAVFEGQPGVQSPPIYTLQFKARKTIWRYYLTGLTADQIGSTEIEPVSINEGNVSFSTGSSLVKLPTGQSALEIKSNQPIPLADAPKMRVMLRSDGMNDTQRLPCAGPDIALADDGKTWVSNIFVRV